MVVVAAGLVPRQHPRRPGRVGPARPARAVPALARGGTAHEHALRVPLPVPRHTDRLRRPARRRARAHRSWPPGPQRVAAFIAEPVAGAALGACVPPDDYWPAVVEVCRRHGVLLIADEVMTGFGRTGRWFACEHWDVRPDIVVAAKGASSGYWPLGFAASTGAVHDTIAAGGFTHGFTYSHHQQYATYEGT